MVAGADLRLCCPVFTAHYGFTTRVSKSASARHYASACAFTIIAARCALLHLSAFHFHGWKSLRSNDGPRYFPGVVMMVVCCYAKELLVLFAARASQPFFDAAPTLLSVVSIRLPTKSFTLCTRLASSPPLLGSAGLIKVNDSAVTSANHSLIKAGCY